MMRWRVSALTLSPRLTLVPMTALLVSVFLGAVGEAQTARGEFEGEGRVVAVDAAAATVTLDHGPIAGLMPPMRMRFTVGDQASLKNIKVGDLVRFSLGSRDEQMIIVTLEPLGPGGPAGR
jgi:Cu/Ag efflux protein CusF